jgi:hypothetical protein
VVCADGSVDVVATEALRDRRLAERPSEPPTFTFGPARDHYREQWPMALEDALAAAIADQPSVVRQFLHHQMKHHIAERQARGETVAPSAIAALVSEVAQRLSAGYPSTPIVEPASR